MRYLIPSTALFVVLALAGCKSIVGCQGPVEVGEGGRSIPPLRVPVGMTEPNKKEALKVPELVEPELPRTDDKCIDQPPSYFPDRRVGAEGKQETEANKAQAKPEAESEAKPAEQPETPPKED